MTTSSYRSAHLKSGRFKKNLLNMVLFTLSIATVVLINTYHRHLTLLSLAGTIIIVSVLYLILYLFLVRFRAEVLQVVSKTFFILLIIIAFIGVTRLISDVPRQNFIYIIPFAMIPVLVRIFYDARLALFILLITILLAGFYSKEPFEFFIITFSSGMIAIFTLTNVYRRSILLLAGLMVVITSSVVFLGLSLVRDSDIGSVSAENFIFFTYNGLLVLLSYPLILIFEKRFLFISDVTLMELSDTGQPLLRKLADEAPGSFQHSLQVANLAEEAARTIGANTLLVRTGSLYHDIGKIANPKYFIENQTDEQNPHDSLDPMTSSKLILNHVKNGAVLAKNYKIPVQVIDFIRTHHGTTTAYFFYRKYSDLYPGISNNKDEFTYPGPKPFSRETAIVMMADAVEAASRTLSNYSDEEINDLVDRIIHLQEQDGQFSDVPLTFRDISDIKAGFKKRLSNIYHSRIAYPGRP